MSLPLTIWLPDDLNQPWPWFHEDQEGTAVSQADKSGFGALQLSPIHVIVSGQSVKQIKHDLPPMKDTDKLAAARFAIENSVGSPLSGQHVVIGGQDQHIVSVISHAKMKDISDHLTRADILPSGLYADFDVLTGDLPLLLPDRAVYPGAGGYTLDRHWADLTGPEIRHSQAMTLFDVSSATNLLAGEYAKAAALPFSKSGLIKTAALLLACFTALLGYEWSQSRAIEQHVQVLRAEASDLYTAVTGTSAPSNPALAVTRAVKSGNSSESNFLELSQLLFASIAQTDGIMIETLQYDRQKNELGLRLIYPQFESAGALEDAVKDSGGVFRSGGVREQSGRLIGDAVVEARP